MFLFVLSLTIFPQICLQYVFWGAVQHCFLEMVVAGTYWNWFT